ncbi:MAG: monovalent cation/H+ antiporter subunit D family protein [Granulosicoccus sp.]|nr:monovalent cation/H+ antiporter subunit D family protein [Granulosicoccus sp.]
MNPLWTLVPPLAVIPFIVFFGEKRNNLREGSIIVAGLILLLINNRIYSDLTAGIPVQSGELALLADYSLKLSAEPMGVIFGLLASFLWVVTTVYSIGYMRGHHEINQTRFYVCFAIALAAVMGAAYADNLLTLFVAYEVITISTFPLVTHAGSEEAKKAGRLYLGILMSTSIGFLLPAIIWVATAAGTMDFIPGGVLADAGIGKSAMAVLLALFVFGIAKAGIMPFHRWLPAAMVAPTPVSALLHAVAVVKTGVFSVLKIVTYTFGIDTVTLTGAAHWLLPVAAFTILASSIVAFTKDNLKARLAYSTISQLSYIILAALLATVMSVSGGVLHIVMHAFGKITLFFCAGAIMVALHKSEISRLDGIGRRMPLTMGAFFIGALSIIGLPPAGGVWSKLLIAGGSLDSGTLIWVGVLMLSTLLNIAYLLPIPLRAFLRPDPDLAPGEKATWQEAPYACLWAIVLTATTCVLLFLYPQPLTELIGLIQWR